jgi:hypothetical protein
MARLALAALWIILELLRVETTADKVRVQGNEISPHVMSPKQVSGTRHVLRM